MKILVSTNPAKNYQKVGSVAVSSLREIKKKVQLANKAKLSWKELGAARRVKLLYPLYKEILRRQKEIALLTTREIGKPISEALGDIEWDLGYLKEFLRQGPEYLKDEVTYKDKSSVHKIVYEPIGTTATIVPWNFPFGNFLWGVIPNLIAGNTVVFKHSEECPLIGKLAEEMIARLKLPRGVFSEVYGDGEVGEKLVKQSVDFIWFTGSSAVGKRLYEIAGRKFVKAVMEMGGSNPTIVFDDVDPDEIIESILNKRFSNCGQVCDALKRLIVDRSIFNEVVKRLKDRIEKVSVGDPEDEKTQIGSLVAKRQLDLLESQVADAVAKGAIVVTGGKFPAKLKGAYYLPTILTNIKWDMRVWKEEVFGPVLPIVSFKSEEEAINIANDTVYGLGARIYSKDEKRALRVVLRIEGGDIDINTGDHWRACNPFGGYKDSGMGREHGKQGFQELCQIKVIAVGR